ncbi:MAG: TonB-dependent receptor [Pirellulales bacterium]
MFQQHARVCALALAVVLSGPARPAAAQPPAPSEPESAPAEPDAAPAIVSDEDLPVLPETTVIGRPQPGGSPDTGYPSASPVVSATRTPIRSGDVGSSISVITEEQIRAKGQTSVAEVLRGLPGVDVVQQGGPGRVTSLFLRGGSSEHTKVLLDGLPLNDPITPGRSFDFSTLSVDNIERIEILRGPQSTLYGSDAIGGVVNIITRRGRGPPSGRLGVMGGSFGTSHESASVSGSTCDWHYALSGSYFDTDGFSAADERLPGNTENDAFRLGTLGGRTGWTPYENFDVDFVFRYHRGTAEIDDGGGPFMDDPNERNFAEQAFARTQLRYATVDDLWEQTLAFNFADHNRRTIDPADILHPSDAFFSRFNSQLHMLDWQHNLLLLEGNTLTVGAVYADETGASSFTGESAFGPFEGDMPEQSLRNTGVYLQDQLSLGDRWFTTLGARQDHYSQAGTADTYRATSLYRLLGTETALRGSIGTGFKAPTLFQLFDAFSGNLDLLPEESKGWDVGLEQPLGRGRLVIGATYFRNDFENLIDFDPSTFRFFNVGRALATGVELSSLYIVSPATSLIALTPLAKMSSGSLARPAGPAIAGLGDLLNS